jgi:LysR family transcriptional regulator, benzoate and cis,cis-muconate-responsive activator of ben and cat genes
METRKLEIFVEVARELHFGRAAERLYMNQSTVSEAVRSLEKELGGALFERTSRRVMLTALGESLLREIEPTIIALNATLDAARKQARGERSELLVGYLGGGFYEFTAPLLAEFERLRSDVKMTLVELTYIDQIEAVRNGNVDVALVRLPVGLPELRRGAILFQDQRMLAIPSGHRLSDSALVDPEELRHERMVRLPPGIAPPAWLAYHFPPATPAGAPIAEGPTIHTVREGLSVVAAGQAVMTITARAQDYFRHPGVTFVEIDLPPIQSALVSRVSDHRQVIRDIEAAGRKVATRMGVLVSQPEQFVPA